eukprot:COSAG02_NODE_4003_length_5927_cov_5.624914_6_plen_45_part_00
MATARLKELGVTSVDHLSQLPSSGSAAALGPAADVLADMLSIGD